jgi:DNA-binding transcriptional LysR family regulator
MAKGHVTRGELVRLFDDWQMAPMPLTLAYAPNRHVSARLRVFIDWVGEVMAHV